MLSGFSLIFRKPFTKFTKKGNGTFAHVWQMYTCRPRSSKPLHRFLHDARIIMGVRACVRACARVFPPKKNYWQTAPDQKCYPVSLLWVVAPHVFSKKQPQETRSRNQATQASTSPGLQERVAWLLTSLFIQRALAKQSWDGRMRMRMMVVVVLVMAVMILTVMHDHESFMVKVYDKYGFEW